MPPEIPQQALACTPPPVLEQDQVSLASSNADNKLLQYRGNAGTHDLALGTETLCALRDLSDAGAVVRVPRSVFCLLPSKYSPGRFRLWHSQFPALTPFAWFI